MLRGAIEIVTESSVSGWIYADGLQVRGMPILAFDDGVCVGSGEVSLFRKDLSDAGLGDGFLGFHFPISLTSPERKGSVVVRLEGSDASLIAESSVVKARTSSKRANPGNPRKTSCIQWMREKGWLEQSEFDYLTFLDQLGVYDRALRPAKRGSGDTRNLDDAEAVARTLLELHYMTDLIVEVQQIDAVSDLPEIFAKLEPPSGQDIVAVLTCSERARIAVLEGSHRESGETGAQGISPTEYILASDRLLVLNTLCPIEAKGLAPSQGLTIYYARSNER